MTQPGHQQSSRSMRLTIVGIVLIVLLGIVALVSRGHVSPAGGGAHDRGASQALANGVFTLWIIAMLVGVGLLAYTMSIKRGDSKRETFRIKPLLFSLLFFAAVVIGMVIGFNKLGNKNPRQPQAPVAIGTKHLKKGDKTEARESAESPRSVVQLVHRRRCLRRHLRPVPDRADCEPAHGAPSSSGR